MDVLAFNLWPAPTVEEPIADELRATDPQKQSSTQKGPVTSPGKTSKNLFCPSLVSLRGGSLRDKSTLRRNDGIGIS